ncbi:rhomboid family intramembrane serine protease [Croceiramulus getboli]|nr:rhomboid family intramembrane serine protease [Flavobacteriaceae bacterium YJPT1-3]
MARITETVKILIITNVLVWLCAQFLLPSAIEILGLWFPKNPNFQVWQPLTHMFMHDQSSIFHILFNMYALWMFGSPIEAILGQKRFIFFYFSAGLGAALIHTLVNYYYFNEGYQALLGAGLGVQEIENVIATTRVPQYVLETVEESTLRTFVETYYTPAVGASGAIYGVLVAFGMMFPNMELMLIFVPIPIKAKYFIPALILLDLFSGVTGFSVFGQNIANWAHLGGALFGFIMMWYWKRNSFNDKRWY